MSAGSQASLAQGTVFTTGSGRRGTVDDLLGAGGQGEAYRVTLDGLAFALKWYHPQYVTIDTGLRLRLERAVRRGAPTADFLWPIDLVDIPHSGSFGYFMKLRGPEYVSIRDLIAPPPRRLELPLAQRATICLQLANAFLELHASGFCYQDINFGNIFIEAAQGRVLICDNDNVNVDGAEASIYGTRKFMAPEVVRRECLPSSRTDLFSMAILFFYILFGWHPLDGRREAEIQVLDADAELRLYGADPLFLFDPHNPANGPMEGLHEPIVARWRSLPEALRALFVRAFGPGLQDPAARVLETEWRAPLRTAAEASFPCGACGFDHCADPQRGGLVLPDTCLSCGSRLEPPPMLCVRARTVALTTGRTVPGDAIGLAGSPSGAAVEPHPSRPGIFGLRNLSGAPWRVTLEDSSSHQVPPGQAVRIMAGTRIEFGRVTGIILNRSHIGGPSA